MIQFLDEKADGFPLVRVDPKTADQFFRDWKKAENPEEKPRFWPVRDGKDFIDGYFI